jgi:hypothetical protein
MTPCSLRDSTDESEEPAACIFSVKCGSFFEILLHVYQNTLRHVRDDRNFDACHC